MTTNLITLDEIIKRLDATGLPKMDRHVIRRLYQAGFLSRQDAGIGLPSLFPVDSINALKALQLASISIYGYGPGSRVDNKNTIFFIARAISNCYMRIRKREHRIDNVLMRDFINVLNVSPGINILDKDDGKLSLAGYLVGGKANYILIDDIPEEQATLVKKTLVRDGMDTIKHFATIYFYFISILEGNIVEDMYENTKAFLNYVKNTPTASGADISTTLISDMKPFGEKTKSFITANENKAKAKTTYLLSTYDNANTVDFPSPTIELATTVLNLLALLETCKHNQKDIMAWLDFSLRYDNHTLWLTREVVKPALVRIGCNIDAFDANTLYLAAEFMVNLGYLRA